MLDQLKEYDLFVELSSIHSPSGNTERIVNYLYNRFGQYSNTEIYKVGESLIVKKGSPAFAFFVHLDTVGFILQSNDTLLSIGNIDTDDEHFSVISENNETFKVIRNEDIFQIISQNKDIIPGTFFTYETQFYIKDETIHGTYLDNRMCLFLMCKIFEKTDNILLAFSTDEEIQGGSVIKLSKFIYENLNINKAIVCDITFATERVKFLNGIALTFKDEYIPSICFVKKVEQFFKMNGIKTQREIENFGQSDGAFITISPYPIEWAFIGIPVKNNHSPMECASLFDVNEMYKAIHKLAESNLNI